jgi:hypothetical protein
MTDNRSCPGGEAGARVQLGGGNAQESSPDRVGPQGPADWTVGLGGALREELRCTAPADRPEALKWLAGRCLLGLAHECGFEAAASFSYACADALACAGDAP